MLENKGSSTVRVSAFNADKDSDNATNSGIDNNLIFKQKYTSKNSIKLILSRSHKKLGELLHGGQDSRNTPSHSLTSKSING